ncbi:MAG: hypothetical protein ACK4N5_17665 [Myxococcales bacterium]
MGLLSGIGKAIGKVTSIANKVLSFVKKPMDFVMKPLEGVLGKLADKLPLGLGNLVKPFIGKFLSTGLSWLAGGPLGGFLGLLGKVAPTVEKVANVLNMADKAINGGLKNLPQPALENAQNIAAHAHAQTLAA